MELDSDLGIDSIKRVEIFSALQERLPQAPPVKSEHLGTLRTLQQVVDFLIDSPNSFGGNGQPLQNSGSEVVRDGDTTNVTLTASHHSPLTTHSVGQINSILLDVVAGKTGYPAEMLEIDMELDSDLGIDSIKRVEIFSALQERLPEAPMVKSEHLGSLRTLRQVVEFLSGKPTPSVPEPAELSPPVRSTKKAETSAVSNAADPVTNGYRVPDSVLEVNDGSLRRFVLSVQSIAKENPRKPVVIPKGGEFWITDDGGGLADKLAEYLAQHGFVSTLLNIQGLGKLSSPSQLAGLIILAPVGETPDRFLHEAFGLLKIASSGLRSSGKSGGSVFVTVSRMDGAFGLKNPSDPVSGGLAGIAKTAGKEWPEVDCKAVDLAPVWHDMDQAAEAVGEEILVEGPVEVGLSQQGPVSLVLAERALTAPASTFQNGLGTISKNEVILLTGGARGVTAEVAVALARAGHSTLVLLGRSPEPGEDPSWLIHLKEESEIKKALLAHASNPISPRELEEQYRQVAAQREIRNTLDRIQETGDKSYYRSLDIRDERAVKAVLADIRSRLGPIRGIVHGAGVLADRRIEDKTFEQFDQVYSTKVAGLRTLLDALDENELRFQALMSSSSARFGRAGQVDYAAANEVLNKLAQREARRFPQCRVVSVNWGPWDGGMVTPSLKKIFADEGMGLILLKAGAEFLVHEIHQSSDPAVEVVVLANSAVSRNLSSNELNGSGEGVSREGSEPEHSPLTPHHPSAPMTIAFERTLNVEQYPFLTSHVIDGKAVLPLAMMMEWLAHGALHGNPGLVFHGHDNVRVFHGVILEEDQHCTIRVLAGPGDQKGFFTHVPVELHSLKGEVNGEPVRGKTVDGRLGHSSFTTHPSPVVYARAEVILATRLPDPEFQAPDLLVELYSRDPAEIYSKILFHGPDLQGIDRVEGLSIHGIIGTVNGAPAPAAWIRVPLRHAWLSDPLAVDAAIQLAVLWAYEQHGMASLPCFVGAYRQFRRFLSRESIRVVVQVKKSVAHRATADITMLDREGNVGAGLENL